MVQAGVFRAADPVLDPGVGAVAGVEMGELPERGVGGEGGVAPAVGLFERVELRAGVRAFPAHDHPRPGRVAGQDRAGRTPVISARPGAVAVAAVGVDRVRPHALAGSR